MRAYLAEFIQFCLRFKKVDTSAYQVKLTHLADLSEFALNELCQPATLDEIRTSDSRLKPRITCFEHIGSNYLELIERINGIDKSRSVMFNVFFEDTCAELTSTKIDLRQVLDQVIPSTLSKWSDLAKKIESGQIALAEIDGYLSRYFDNKDQKFIDEFSYICAKNFSTGKQNLKKRKNQLEIYFKFKSSLRAAELLIRIKERYDLKGNFHNVI